MLLGSLCKAIAFVHLGPGIQEQNRCKCNIHWWIGRFTKARLEY